MGQEAEKRTETPTADEAIDKIQKDKESISDRQEETSENRPSEEGGWSAEDSTTINEENEEPIDPRMPQMPPA